MTAWVVARKAPSRDEGQDPMKNTRALRNEAAHVDWRCLHGRALAGHVHCRIASPGECPAYGHEETSIGRRGQVGPRGIRESRQA